MRTASQSTGSRPNRFSQKNGVNTACQEQAWDAKAKGQPSQFVASDQKMPNLENSNSQQFRYTPYKNQGSLETQALQLQPQKSEQQRIDSQQ